MYVIIYLLINNQPKKIIEQEIEAMKKIIILVFAIILAFSLVACKSATTTQLGTSDFTIDLPQGYESAEDDFDEDQVAYFYKDDNSIDFDVYQWEKGDQYTLESEAKAFADMYGTVAEAVTINGINGWKYVSEEKFDGDTYTVINYMVEDDKYIVEICFWTNNSDAERKGL